MHFHGPICAMGDRDYDIENVKLSFILVGFVSAALVVTIYHMIAAGWCHPNRDRQGQGPQQDQGQEHHHSLRHEILEMSSLENSTAQLIPARKYQKGIGFGFGLVDDDDDGICAVCLSEFEEGEEVRTLPECLHTFHAPCIDMWLYSHTSCPMCRADATPSSQVPDRRPLDSGISPPDSRSVRLNAGMLQIIVQSRTM